MTIWAAIIIQTVALLGTLAGVYVKIIMRLTIIETTLASERDRRIEKQAARIGETRLALIEHCNHEHSQCPARREYMTDVRGKP